MESARRFLSNPSLIGKSAIILLLAFLVYWPAVNNGFIWDDDVMLTGNDLMKAEDGLRRIWLSTELSDYFPLTSTSFWIEWHMWGTNPVGYNVTNIVLHALAGIFLWRVLLRLKVPGAWFAAILFTVHPVCVASVDWIAERKNTLSMVFYFAAFLLFLRFEANGSRRTYLLALGTFLLALLSKTSVVILPVVLLLCAWWQRSSIVKRDIIRTAPFFALSLLLGLVTVWFQLHEILKGEAEPTDPFLVRVLGGGYAIWFYLAKAIVPTKLSMVYPRWEIDAAGFVWYLPAVLWIAALIIFWRFRHTWGRPFLFGLGYFTIALLPVLGIFPMDYLRFSQVADHLAYIALPGAIALVVGLSVVVLKRHLAFSASQPFGLRCALAVPVVVLSILTWKQSSVYVNEETLWRDTIKKNPSGWIGYHNLADTLAELRRYEEATYYYQQSLQLEPTYAKTHNNLGNCLFFLGKLDDAVEQFMDAVKDKPELAEAHHNLGMAHYKRKQYAEALAAFQKAIELQPDYASAYSGAGNTELQFGRVAEALDHYFNAAKYNPDGSDIQYNIGIILSARGETNAAVHFLKRALRLRPDDELARQELNLLLASTDVSQ